MRKVIENSPAFIEKQIQLIRRKMKVGPGEAIDPYLMARKIKIPVLEYSMTDIDGCLLSCDNSYRILLNNRIASEGRKKFTVGHELGHRVLHCVAGACKSFMCSSAEIKYYQGSHVEVEANLFASELLMPRVTVKHLVDARPACLDIVSELVDKFGVSKLAAIRRMIDVSNQRLAAFVSDGESIKYVWKREESQLYIRRDQEIDESSTAFECEDSFEQSIRIGMLSSNSDYWIPSNLDKDRCNLFEQSYNLYDGLILTLVRIEDC